MMDIQVRKEPDGLYHAIDADNYEAECDSVGWWSTSAVGYGKTPQQAIEDLLAEIEDRKNSPPSTTS